MGQRAGVRVSNLAERMRSVARWAFLLVGLSIVAPGHPVYGVDYYLPYHSGETWTLTYGPHDLSDGPSGTLGRHDSRLTVNQGWDFSVHPEGRDVIASAPGTVVELENEVPGSSTAQPWGNYVLLQHSDGTLTRYAHLQYHSIPPRLLSLGQYASQGEKLGQEGMTGDATGPHVHFQREDLQHHGLHCSFVEGNSAPFTSRNPGSGGGPTGVWLDVGRTTRSPWAAAEYSGHLWALHLGEYGTKMYLGFMEPGGNWNSNWQEAPGDSDDAVDITSTGSLLVLAHRGLDNNIYWGTVGDNNKWTGWMWTQRSTTAPPSVTVWNGRVWMIHKGLNNETMYYASCDPYGNSWSQWWEFDGQVRDRPSIAVFNGDLWAMHRGTDNKIYLRNVARGTGWTWNQRTTISPPSMVEYSGRLYVIHRGETSDHMYLGSMGGDGSWRGWLELPGWTQMQPRLVVFQGRLYAIHVGYDHHMYIMDVTSWL
jgi:hypothetical protein